MLRAPRLALLVGSALLLALPASAEDAVCSAVPKVPLQRHLRQLSLDLLGRPPTIEEYQAVQDQGAITSEAIRGMMEKEDFYARMRAYHRALLRSNISLSVNDNANSRVSGNGLDKSALGITTNPSAQLRGAFGAGCDNYAAQSACKSYSQDEHLEGPASAKECYDSQGVPLPVSVDYDTTNYYACTQLDATTIPEAERIASCTALGNDAARGKYLYFCDNRRHSDGTLHPYLCLPSPAKSTTAALTVEVTDDGKPTGKVVAFQHPDPASKPALTELKRCSLKLVESVRGSYSTQRGCIEREGYEVRPAPYWANTADPVRVCAIEAQSRSSNPWTMESCETPRFPSDRSCGCGDKMRRCEILATKVTTVTPPIDIKSVHDLRVAAFNEEPLLIADSVLRRNEPYFNILTTRRSFVNGTLSEYYRQNQGVGVFSTTAPAAREAIPALGYADDTTWKEYTRDASNSGVLTTPGFLYRFPTQRSRVNQFYDAFLCKSFVPAADASLPPPEDACNRENNLAKRCGCNYCHATIEPTGAHWGRYAERASLFLAPSQFPRFDPKCRDCALGGDTNCGGECAQYVMQAYDGDGANSLGMLKTYLYRTADEEQNIESGPKLLVERMMQTGDLERCAVKRVWHEFLGRPMTTEEQRMYLTPLSQDFVSSGHNLKALIERVVTTDAYRRID